MAIKIEEEPNCLGRYGWGDGFVWATDEGLQVCPPCPLRDRCQEELPASKWDRQIAYLENFDAGAEAVIAKLEREVGYRFEDDDDMESPF